MIYLLIIELILILILIKYSFSLQKYLEEIKGVANKILDKNYNFNLNISKNSNFYVIKSALENLAEQMQLRDFQSNIDTSKIQAILSTVPEGLIAIDLDEKIIFANQKAKELVGILNLEEGDKLFSKIYDPIVSKKLKDLIYGNQGDIKETIYRKHLHFRVSKIIKGKENIPIGSLISITDITEVVQTENIRRDFVSNVTHELKTPITSISGFVETLIENKNLPVETQQKFLNIIEEETKRLNELIDDTLTLSFIEEVEVVSLERVNLVKILKDIIFNIKYQAEHKNITIDFNCDKNNIFIQSNKNYLTRIFINLIDNSIKYSPIGAKVGVAVTTEDKQVIISIKDNGRGIAEEDIERVFERFFRADRSRNKSEHGTGLGLAIVKHLVKSLNGTITLNSNLGEGSEFIVSLPLEY